MAEKGVLIVVSGFSGAGKGTIVKKIVSESPELSLSISMTTREPREGEVDGKSYFFVSKERFEEAISNGELLEFATFVGNYYGTPRKYVEEMISQGKDVILEIEMQGAIQVKTRFPEAILIFVTPPSAHELKRRLTERGTEDEATINKRMHRAYEESEFIDRYDYLLVNDDLDKCVEELHGLIEASHHKPDCSSGLLKKINEELKEYI
ncbi:MAG: guanylate kinase [Lachnospiraceae bacterium]|nr:guanylate kinase [Lachnospiraceae bacterium]MBR6389766.1 guanylate kinase [Lachnospiraceae bacterium]